jgi:two-component system, NarL family, sensor histidine kinase DesK
MKWPKLPTGAEKPSWAGLFGCLSVAYVFVDPYQRNAPWIEWLWTGVAFLIFLVLSTLGAIYWSREHVMRRVCLAMAVLGAAFTAYRPSGVFFFIMVAAFGPLAAGGRAAASVAITLGAVLLIVGEWSLLWPYGPTPYIAAVEALLVGGAITFVMRQQFALRRILKTAERERIARDLHDILGHTLSVIILKSELASRLLEHDPKRARAEIDDVERISRNALSEVREAIVGYRAGDLVAELERAKSTLETAGIVVERHCEDVSMPAAYERVLALALREAVTNVVRHAQAKNCRLTLQQGGGVYSLGIRDDGRGGNHQEGLGMRGIRERVLAIGGTTTWQAGQGTELTITVPVTAVAGDKSHV